MPPPLKPAVVNDHDDDNDDDDDDLVSNWVAAGGGVDVDDDECQRSPSPCAFTQLCLNSYGSYVCLRTTAAAAALSAGNRSTRCHNSQHLNP